jgi:hypothetical protein
MHNGLCLNDQRSGGNGSHAILYTCSGAANEIWTHLANGELQLKANGGKYCLDDPAYSTTSGTQLILYSCKDSSNQRWSERLYSLSALLQADISGVSRRSRGLARY